MSAISEGFPQLALFKKLPKDFPTPGDRFADQGFYFPSKSSIHRTLYTLVYDSDLILLVAPAKSFTGDKSGYYFVPFKLVENGTLPPTSVTRWVTKHKYFPILAAEEVILLDQTWIKEQKHHDRKHRATVRK